MIEFQWSWAFYLLPLPIIVWFLIPAAKEKESNALVVPFFGQLEGISHSPTSSIKSGGKYLFFFSLLLIWILVITALARPIQFDEAISLPAEGRDIMIAVDVSGSMETPDMVWNNEPVNRLFIVKKVISDFIGKRVTDRMGLILFGTQAYLQSPLSFDRKITAQLLNESEIGIAGKATAIGDAIGLAIKRLKDTPKEGRLLLLLTDGQNTEGEVEPVIASELAANIDLKIYTVGIGADEMQTRSFFGFSNTVNPSRDLDEKMLKQIAKNTGGLYFRAKNTEDLRGIYEKVDQLEPIPQEHETVRPQKSLLHWPLGIALILSFLLMLSFYAANLRQTVRL